LGVAQPAAPAEAGRAGFSAPALPPTGEVSTTMSTGRFSSPSVRYLVPAGAMMVMILLALVIISALKTSEVRPTDGTAATPRFVVEPPRTQGDRAELSVGVENAAALGAAGEAVELRVSFNPDEVSFDSSGTGTAGREVVEEEPGTVRIRVSPEEAEQLRRGEKLALNFQTKTDSPQSP